MTVISDNRIVKVKNISNLKKLCWGGALNIIDKFDSIGMGKELIDFLDKSLKDNPTDLQLNDYIWFDLENTYFYKNIFE